MAEEVYMDIPQVENMSKSFETFGEVLEAVSKALQAISMMLKATAFVSLGATAAASAFIDRIQPRLKAAGQKMQELSGDLKGAIASYRDGDNSGSQRFA
ncbi:hypothetical protein KQH54_00105 [bacterium]|nr:hypothetical protein [bacterium]